MTPTAGEKKNGSDLWLFSGSSNNVVNTVSHSSGNYEILVDDRSDNATRFSTGSSYNHIVLGPTWGGPKHTVGIGIEGLSSSNQVQFGLLNVSRAGVEITGSQQWADQVRPRFNRLAGLEITSANAAVLTDNIAPGQSGNLIVCRRVNKGYVSLSVNDTLLAPSSNPYQSDKTA